jgi:hypothetical protein
MIDICIKLSRSKLHITPTQLEFLRSNKSCDISKIAARKAEFHVPAIYLK